MSHSTWIGVGKSFRIEGFFKKSQWDLKYKKMVNIATNQTQGIKSDWSTVFVYRV